MKSKYVYLIHEMKYPGGDVLIGVFPSKTIAMFTLKAYIDLQGKSPSLMTLSKIETGVLNSPVINVNFNA